MNKYFLMPDISVLGDADISFQLAVNRDFIYSTDTAVIGVLDGGSPCYINLSRNNVLIQSDKLSGKSKLLHAIILSMLFKYEPKKIRFIFIDTKGYELDRYDGLPHSLTPSTITDFGQALSALHWAVGEGERRYALFSEMRKKGYNVSNLNKYNDIEGVQPLSKIVIILNDFKDILNRAPQAFLNAIIRILQKYRFVGINLIMSAQAVDAKVFPNYLLQNIETKILFKNASDDMLLITDSDNKPVRGFRIGDKEIFAVTNFIKKYNQSHFSEEIIKKIKDTSALEDYDGKVRALKFCIKNGCISLLSLQSGLSIDEAKAIEIFEWLVSNEYITSDEEENRKVLITEEQFISIYGKLL